MTAVIVTGGRHYANAEKVAAILGPIGPRVVVHGGATGADHLAAIWAVAHGINSVAVYADWKGMGRKAGPMRNAEMLRLYPRATVVAFPGGKGTADCVKQARAIGMPIVTVDGAA